MNTSGFAATTVSSAPSLRRKSGVSTSTVVSGAARRMAANCAREMPCPAVVEIVAVDRGHDDMLKAKLGDGVADALGLVLVERAGQPRAHVAKGAGARAGVAHDHEGRVPLVPALADVGAARLLADGRELEFANQAHGLGEYGRAGSAHPDPGRLAGDGLVRPVRLLRVAQVGLARRSAISMSLVMAVM